MLVILILKSLHWYQYHFLLVSALICFFSEKSNFFLNFVINWFE